MIHHEYSIWQTGMNDDDNEGSRLVKMVIKWVQKFAFLRRIHNLAQ